ncbi:DUF6891 domain-containing protein [Corynebacterium nasicanis]|uniref:DUF6891 domain-containing protein n=1 Tax=Corynebacterium nasicanis TaxID=1448267 RepID=A0ABW1QEC2_9CORY
MTHPWNTRPSGLDIPAHWPADEETREFLEDHFWSLLVRGESDAAAYLDAVEDEAPDVDEDEAAAYVDSLIAWRRAQLADLGARPTSRLTEAFAELATIGVIAREDFSCCGTCGHAEIGEELDVQPGARGFVYYHEQDTERLVADRATYIGYGVFLGAYLSEEEWEALSEAEQSATYERLTVALMRDEVIPLLRRHGIGVEWNEELSTRILLTDVDFFASI